MLRRIATLSVLIVALLAPAAHAALPTGGFSAFQWPCATAGRTDCVDTGALAGLHGHRFAYRFGVVEAQIASGAMTWDTLRSTVAATHAAGGSPVAVVIGSPAFAAQAVSELAGLAAVQIGNEPNMRQSAAAYAATLCQTAKLLAGRVPALSAGLAPRRDYLAYAGAVVRAWRRCGHPTLAAFGFHPYAQTPRATVALLRAVRRVLDRNGAARLAIIASEFGVTSAAHGEQGQAHYLAATLRALHAARGLRLAGAWWFGWADLSASQAQAGGPVYARDSSLAMRRQDGTLKPVWAVWTRSLR